MDHLEILDSSDNGQPQLHGGELGLEGLHCLKGENVLFKQEFYHDQVFISNLEVSISSRRCGLHILDVIGNVLPRRRGSLRERFGLLRELGQVGPSASPPLLQCIWGSNSIEKFD